MSRGFFPEFPDLITSLHQSHTSIIDRNGMAVAFTTSVNSVFGSHLLDPTTGMVLNDEMDDFSVPGTPNDFGLWPSPCTSSSLALVWPF
jgi:gamma-glutamyltranspeptidase/glutathione hydrolase/leukotriene-C4 hydrolase